MTALGLPTKNLKAMIAQCVPKHRESRVEYRYVDSDTVPICSEFTCDDRSFINHLLRPSDDGHSSAAGAEAPDTEQQHASRVSHSSPAISAAHAAALWMSSSQLSMMEASPQRAMLAASIKSFIATEVACVSRTDEAPGQLVESQSGELCAESPRGPIATAGKILCPHWAAWP